MSTLLNKVKKYKLTILAVLLALLILYIINFYMDNSFFKLMLWILVIVGEVYIIQYEKKLNKR